MASNQKDINKFIHDLKYNRDTVLTYTVAEIGPIETREGHLDDETKTFTVIKREKKTAYNGRSAIGVTESSKHKTFPGSLLLANRRLVEGSPDVIAVDRAPLKYTIDLPGLTDEGSFTIVPTYSNYQSALNKVLNTWFDKYQNHDISVRFQSEQSLVYSLTQARVKFGSEFVDTSVEENINFSAVENNEKLTMIHRFKQIFYTVTVEGKNNPAELFGPEVTRQDLESKCSNETPPVIVDNICYGRCIYVVIETSSTDRDAKAILETKFKKFDARATGEVDYTKALKEFSMKVFVMGGSSKHVGLIEAKSLEEVNKIIVELRKFGPENSGYPLYYSSEFIRENSRAIISTKTDYMETIRTQLKKGVIRIKHLASYTAEILVQYDLVTYENSRKILKRVDWPGSWVKRQAPYEEVIELPGNARNIRIFVRAYVFDRFQWLVTIIDRSGIPLIEERKVSLWGSVIFKGHSITPDD